MAAMMGGYCCVCDHTKLQLALPWFASAASLHRCTHAVEEQGLIKVNLQRCRTGILIHVHVFLLRDTSLT